MSRCPFCGVELKKTNHGRLFCPNHGIISKDEEEKGDDESAKLYVG